MVATTIAPVGGQTRGGQEISLRTGLLRKTSQEQAQDAPRTKRTGCYGI